MTHPFRALEQSCHITAGVFQALQKICRPDDTASNGWKQKASAKEIFSNPWKFITVAVKSAYSHDDLRYDDGWVQ
jgi:hypothetical protein